MSMRLFLTAVCLPLFLFGADASTLTGKVLCGYQGWFRTPDDGADMDWAHYGVQGKFEPGFAGIDVWPDVRELDADERVDTPFRNPDGSVAQVFSSMNPKTVKRHFKWMADCGIDGACLQRFVCETKDAKVRKSLQQVMSNVRAGAEAHERTWCVMYDFSGVGSNELVRLVKDDWKNLVNKERVLKDKMYQLHGGKAVVVLWGIGFNDGRSYTPAECLELVKFFKEDKKYGGHCVVVGVPTYWREEKNDCLKDPTVRAAIEAADIVCPWTVGRLRNAKDMENYTQVVAAADLAWCRERQKELLPVVYPGFSWHNLMKGRGKEAPLNDIPRRGGQLLVEQLKGHMKNGCTMAYAAMFDEMDEGTALFKCSPKPPTSTESPFYDIEGVSSDRYLRILGAAAEQLKKQQH